MSHPRLLIAGSLFSLVILGAACMPVGAPTDPGGGGGAPAAGTGGQGGAGGRGAGTGGSGAQAGSGGQAGSQPGGSAGSGTAGTTGGTGAGSGGSGPATGGAGGSAGAAGGSGGSTGGRGGSGGQAGGTGGGTAADASSPDMGSGGTGGYNMEKFSFFYTSLDGMRRLSKSQNGFGGDLKFGTTNGLEGADKICQQLATDLGFGGKTWKAFLSATKGPDGMGPVHAINRIGEGPWYDRNGRLIAMNKAGLLAGDRPMGDPQAVADLPDETGQGTKRLGDTHDAITGTNRMGMLASMNLNDTCMDWTSATTRGRIQMGHAWPAGSGRSWVVAHSEPTCVAGVNLVQNGPGNGSSIGAGGGWGGYYCFATTP